MATEVRQLHTTDTQALLAFLEAHLDTSLFLLSNAEAAGLEDHGQPLQGTYVASFADGEITAVAAHYWNGVLIVQGDHGLEQAAQRALACTQRPLGGIIGPLALAERVRRAVGAAERRTAKGDPEILYGLDLAELRVPPVLAAPDVTVRRPTADELEGLLLEWRVASAIENLGEVASAGLRERSREQMARMGPAGWVLCHENRPASFTAFNAATRGLVQVGGVFTPPELRGRGYARGVVAHSLERARAKGERRSILFTARTNIAAQRAYEALGYRAIGDFALILFAMN